MPAEHGAWVMLYTPILATWIAFAPRPGPALLLLTACTTAWLAQSTLPRVLKASTRRTALPWLVSELVIFAASALWLVLIDRYSMLIPIGLTATAVGVAHTMLRERAARKRFDRTEVGQLFGLAGLALTGPAAYVIAGGGFDAVALFLYLSCVAFFASGVLFVHMLLRAIRARRSGPEAVKASARTVLAYHAAVVILLAPLPMIVPVRAALLTIVAFVPAIVRAFVVATRLTGEVPSFKRVGIVESVYATWFAFFIALASRSVFGS